MENFTRGHGDQHSVGVTWERRTRDFVAVTLNCSHRNSLDQRVLMRVAGGPLARSCLDVGLYRGRHDARRGLTDAHRP